VRVTQILVDLHISAQAAQAFNALVRVRHHVQVDAEMLVDDFMEYFPTPEQEAEYRDRRRDYRRSIAKHRDKDGMPDEGDVYSRVLDEAAPVVEPASRQILQLKTFREFLSTQPAKPVPLVWSDEAKKVLGVRRNKN
jgi:hypothetical protein